MTTSRRPRPARASRVLAAGIATASMFGLGASMALAPPPASSAVAQAATTGPTTVIIRRIVQGPGTSSATGSATPSRSRTVQQPRSRTRGS